MSAMMAEYVLYVFGTVIAFLHLFLRANAARTAIKPPEAPWHRRRRFRLFGPNELEIITISPPLHLVNPDYYPRDEKRAAYDLSSLPGTPVLPFPVQTPTRGHVRAGSMAKEPVIPESPGFEEGAFRPHTPHSAYSLFPGGAEDLILPATVYTPPVASSPPPRRPSYAVARRTRSSSCVSLGAFAPPTASASTATITTTTTTTAAAAAENPPPSPRGQLRPPRPPWAPAHRRGRSDDSSATVQIGLRLSAASAAEAQRAHRSLLPQSRLREATRAADLQPITVTTNSSSVPAAEVAFDDSHEALSAALGEQTRGATGRDLNSFRWLDEGAQREAVSAAAVPGAQRRSSEGFALLPGARARAEGPAVEVPRTAPMGGAEGGARWI